MQNLIIAFVATVILLGGPFTLYFAIKLLNSAFGSLKVDFVKLTPKNPDDPRLGIRIGWDEESFALEVFRAKVELYELVPGGRSASFSFTFEGKGAKKRSFLIPMKLSADDFAVLTDGGVDGSKNAVLRSYIYVEVENTRGETERFKIPKKRLMEAMRGAAYTPDTAQLEVVPARAPDEWSLQTRVFPWRTAVAAADAAPAAKGAAKPKAAGGAPALVDFLVTKVWIEPGCIVCDACENEAPQVFHVLPDTCIVRENAPLDDGASIKAAAEGCPVDVIKFETVPKPAAAAG